MIRGGGPRWEGGFGREIIAKKKEKKPKGRRSGRSYRYAKGGNRVTRGDEKEGEG